MGVVQFKKDDTAAKYVALVETDQRILVTGSYDGLLSNVPVEVADGMIKRKTNMLKLKDGQQAPPPTPPVKKEEVKV